MSVAVGSRQPQVTPLDEHMVTNHSHTLHTVEQDLVLWVSHPCFTALGKPNLEAIWQVSPVWGK
jgi:hypothetical protein